jgi:hypothetical protein
LVLVGVALTLALAFLSYVRISPSGVAYRSPEIWSNKATLVLTQEGAPELRSVLPARPGAYSPSLADTGRFASLVDVYATLATSDDVVSKLERRGMLHEEDLKDGALPITAAAVSSTVGSVTPMMTISASSLSGPMATKLTLATTKAFLDVVHAKQLAANIPVKDRIQVRVLNSSEAPTLVDPRSKAMPILVLLGGLIATLAIAFTRDNVARRPKSEAPELTTLPSADEPREPGTSVVAAQARVTPRRPRDAELAIGGARGRATLGSIPRAESPAPQERELPDEAPRRARRR